MIKLQLQQLLLVLLLGLALAKRVPLTKKGIKNFTIKFILFPIPLLFVY